MESPLTYVEIYLEAEGKKRLQSRVDNDKALAEVLQELRGQRFDLFVMHNRCVVGAGTYSYTGEDLVTEYEEGACIGLLDHSFQE